MDPQSSPYRKLRCRLFTRVLIAIGVGLLLAELVLRLWG